MTLREEISSMHEMAHMGEWDVVHLEDRDALFDGPISPEKACFIGSVCARDALDDLKEKKSVSESSAATSFEAFTELDAYYNFSELLQQEEISSIGLKRLVVAKMFWEMRTSGQINGHMFVSAERDNHDLVGEIDGKPTVWRICDTRQQLNGYHLATKTGGMLVAKMPFIETPESTVGTAARSNMLPGVMSFSRLSIL